ncbi:lactonase family protein [Pseudomonas matsuisoli]|uniref:6-phosphogluconolactonase n=1 Tax=Pseudomonas matsuisoli TaxID=1515666 RepID=A0A917PS17_9PSED|nr:lactonase family protein [Pseudomonas matsuisoli]GGJ89487.1 6-phosphogluconolactonase [Pseudomonas matsuisoli]
MPNVHVPSAAAAALFTLQAHAAHVYVSSPGDGDITQYRLDERTGALTRIERFHAGDSAGAMALSPDGSTLFAATRGDAGNAVAPFRIDAESGALAAMRTARLADRMSYLSLDRSGRHLMGASYGGGLVSVQPVQPDGQPLDTATTYDTGPNTHSVLNDPSGRFTYAAVLGADRIAQFRQDPHTGDFSAIDKGYIETPPGIGPRHLAFSPDGRFLYVAGELTGTVVGYTVDPDTGELTEITRAEGIPARLGLQPGVIRGAEPIPDDLAPKLIWVADIRVTPDGTLLYISERTTSAVSAFRIDPENGALRYLETYPVNETQPRNIAIAPSGQWLLVSGEKSAVIGSYRIAADGSIERVSEAPAGKGALWIETRPAPEQDQASD